MKQIIARLSPEEFKKELTQDTILIDVRTEQEQISYGVISEKQLHIDISLPTAGGDIQNLSKTEKYLIYCWHGVRSKQVLDYMQELGFSNVKDLIGGIDKWET